MANVTISDLTAVTSLTGTELFETEQGGVSKRTTAADIAALGGGGGGGTGNDSNDNYSANNFLSAYRTQTTGGLTVTLTVASAYQQYFTGTSTATCKLPVTSTLTLGHRFFIANASTGAVTVQSSGLNTVATLSSGQSAMVTCILASGTTAASWSVVTAGTGGGGGTGDALTSDPLSQFAATTSAQLKSVMTDETGSGALVFGTTPTIDQPILTGSSGVADATTFWRGDKTWSTPPAGAGGGDALVANPLSQFAATTSAQLAGVITNETGTGALVFATGPTLSAPALGTPVSGTLTSCTGLPISTGVSGLGTGVATALGVATGTAGGYTTINGAATITNKTIDNSTNTMVVNTVSTATNLTLTAVQCYGSVIYVTGSATITLPAIVAGMSVTIIAVGAVTVNVDPNGSEVIRLDGTALSAGFKAYNPLGNSGDLIVFTYYGAGVWYGASNAWSDAGS